MAVQVMIPLVPTVRRDLYPPSFDTTTPTTQMRSVSIRFVFVTSRWRPITPARETVHSSAIGHRAVTIGRPSSRHEWAGRLVPLI